MALGERSFEYLIYGTGFSAAAFGVSHFGLKFSTSDSILMALLGLIIGLFFGYLVDLLKNSIE